jgi:hypothetical protein
MNEGSFTYRIVTLRLTELSGYSIDLIDHISEILVEPVHTVGELLSELITGGC